LNDDVRRVMFQVLLNRERALSIMEKKGLDILIATTPEDVTYLSDFRALGHQYLRSNVIAGLPREKSVDPFLIVPIGEYPDLVSLELSWIKDVRCYGTFYIESPPRRVLPKSTQMIKEHLRKSKPKKPIDLLSEILIEKGFESKTIGLDEMGVTRYQFEEFAKNLPNGKITPAYDMIREIRMVKTPREIELLRRAAKITEQAIALTIDSAKGGMTGTELVQIFNSEIVKEHGIPVFTSISVGEDSYLQNIQQPSKRKLRQADLIRFDVGCQYHYYFSDVARTAVMGIPTEKEQNYYKAQLEGEMAALDTIRAGVKIFEIFEAAVKRVRKSGIPNFRRHHCGHGIGIELYDPPLIAPTTAGTLIEGMVLDIEAPYYELGFGGVHSEDMILVTRTGYEPLTTLGRELYQIKP